MSIVQFDRAVILVSWCEQNWGENKMPLGRGGGVNSVGWEGGKNRETVTASRCLAFTELVAPGTATPDWSRDNRVHQSAAYWWQLEWQEVAFITSRLDRFQKNFLETVLTDRLSASRHSLQTFRWNMDAASLTVARVRKIYDCFAVYEAKRGCSRSREDFPFCGSISAPRGIFKRIATWISSTPAHSEISGRNVFGLSAVITDWNFEINVTNTARIWTCGLCHFSAVTRDFSSHINSTQLSNGIESIPCATLTDFTGFFSREETVNWFDQWRRQISTTPLEHETEWSCYSLPIFSAGRALHHPYPRAFCSLPRFARIKGSTSTSTIARKNRGLWTV